ncbi:MAG: hypothetical protein WCW84_01555 [Sulfurimonas sp.]|jgi:hypothetical protein
MSVTKKRRGFAMILAIFIVLLVAAGGALLLSNTTMGAKGVTDGYLHTQAELLLESATEFAVMRAQGFDTSGGNCLNQLDINVTDASGSQMFDINVSLAYSFGGAAPAACTTLAQNTGLFSSVLVDVAVTTNADANISTEPIRVFKRSWQKL